MSNFPTVVNSLNEISDIGRDFVYDGLTPDGQIIYRFKDNSIVQVNPNRDFNKVLKEGIQNGVFIGKNTEKANPYGIVTRCELFHELARYSDSVYYVDSVRSQYEELYLRNKELVDSVCGESSYYKYSFTWLLESNMAVEDLYEYRDMGGAVTWFELAYILYFLVRFKPTYRWTDINPPNNLRVSLITNDVEGVRRVETKLQEYKGSFVYLKSYINAIQTGKKAIPLPVFWALEELRRQFKDQLDSSYSWATIEVTRQDFKAIILPFIKSQFLNK